MDMRAKGCHIREELMAIRRTMRMNEMKEKMVGRRALKDSCGREGMIALSMGGLCVVDIGFWTCGLLLVTGFSKGEVVQALRLKWSRSEVWNIGNEY
tara:strand:+ start:1643 stop:1933 length:291 start_codon:yes stop_codon:yes gene_type:complete